MTLMEPEIRLVNIKEFEFFLQEHESEDVNYELIDGAIVEKPMPTEEHGLVNYVFIGTFFNYFKQNPISRGAFPEVRYQIPGDYHNSRLPDLSITLAPDSPIVKKGAVPRMPDIVVEVKSPTDRITTFRERAAYYLANGTRLVLLVYPEARIIEVYRPNEDIEILTERDTLTGYDLLPGFTLAVKDVFPA